MVLAHWAERSRDPPQRRWAASMFDTLCNLKADYPIPHDVGDFRRLDRKVANVRGGMRGRRRFMKGLFSGVGFRVAEVGYERPSRTGPRVNFPGAACLPWRGRLSLVEAWRHCVFGWWWAERFPAWQASARFFWWQKVIRTRVALVGPRKTSCMNHQIRRAATYTVRA